MGKKPKDQCGKIYRDIEQGTDEWKSLRVGKVTASNLKYVLATTKTGEAATRRDYRTQIVTEMITGKPAEEGFVSKEMERGTMLEPMAREVYSALKGEQVDQVAFIDHPSIRAGCSPDGLVGDDGMLEIKCPKTSTLFGYHRAGVFPVDYMAQVQWQMASSGRLWCDFAAFDDRAPEGLTFFCVRTERDDEYIAKATEAVIKFLDECEKEAEELKAIARRNNGQV